MTICERYQDGDDLHDIARSDNGKYQNRYTLRPGPDGRQQPASTAGFFDTLEQAAAAMHKHRPAAVKITHEDKEESTMYEQTSIIPADLDEINRATQDEAQPQDEAPSTPAEPVKYYPIDETTARISHQMMSMSDYPVNRATNGYRAAVDEAAALVERKKASVSPYYHDKLDALLDRYARRLAQWTNAYNRNGASCPSVMICGPANFPTRKKEKQIAREDALWRERKEIEAILGKIKRIGTGPVDLADPNAREMLTDQLQRLQNTLDTGKAMNAYYRKHKTLRGFPGMSDEAAAKSDEAIKSAPPFAQTPMPDFELASIRGKIKRIQSRFDELDKLQAAKTAPQPAEEHDGFQIVRNAEQNRLQIIFDGKPDEEIRDALKSNGFRWSPRNSAWQRQLTPNAERAARRALGLN